MLYHGDKEYPDVDWWCSKCTSKIQEKLPYTHWSQRLNIVKLHLFNKRVFIHQKKYSISKLQYKYLNKKMQKHQKQSQTETQISARL